MIKAMTLAGLSEACGGWNCHRLDCAVVKGVSAQSVEEFGPSSCWAQVHLCVHEVTGVTPPSPSQVGWPRSPHF